MSHENNDIDRLLQGAFESRTRGGGSALSMVDVRHRARRHQRRRVGGVVGATAMLGVSGVAVLAARGGPEAGIAGDTASTTTGEFGSEPICGNRTINVVAPTPIMLTDGTSPVDFTAPVESIPMDAPQLTYTTVAWTTTTDGAATFTATTFPDSSTPTTSAEQPPGATSTFAPDAYLPFTAPCVPPGQYRCLGNYGTDEQGYSYFEYCEPVSGYLTATTIVITDSGWVEGTIEALAVTTTSTEQVPTTTDVATTSTT